VAQVKNQDPLNPTDSIQFVGQLVSFSQLEQLLGINQGVKSLVGSVTPSSGTTPPASNGTSQ
jgi:flagellar basal-body rod modification protein FlgD